MHRRLQQLILSADLLCIVMCFLLPHPWHMGYGKPHPMAALRMQDLTTVVLACVVWTLLYVKKRLGRFIRGWCFAAVFSQVVVAISYLFVCIIAFYILSYQPGPLQELFSRAWLLLAGFITVRCGIYHLLKSQFHRRAKRRVMIVGSGRIIHELLVKIDRHPELSLEVAGVLFPADTQSWTEEPHITSDAVSLRTLNVLDLINRQEVQEIILVEPVPSGQEVEQMLSCCREAGVKLHMVPQQYELYLSKARLTEVEDVPLLSLEQQTLSVTDVHVKRAIDIVGALCLLMLCAPLLLVVAGLLRWRKGEAFRRELRCGENGVPFWMYRLKIDREQRDLPPVERFMVRFSFTELPQLVNVLKGEMSLVGPRPESTDRVKHYSMWQRQRLAVKPGLTGLAQVHGLREQHSSEEKVNFDLQYIYHWSLFLDLCLLVQTALTLLERLVQENTMAIQPLLRTVPSIGLEMGRMCNADSAQSGTD